MPRHAPTRALMVRVTAAEHAALEAAAELAGKPLSAWLRDLALAASGAPSRPVKDADRA